MTFLLSQEEAEALTRPCHAAMHDAHNVAMERWIEAVGKVPAFMKPLRASEKYAILHRQVAAELANQTLEKVVYTERLGFSALLIDNQALVRFKHLDFDYSVRVYPTDQQQHLRRQQFTSEMMYQLSLDGVTAPPTVLTLGYIETPAGDAIDRVLVVCRTPKLYYAYDVLPGAEASGTPTVFQPFPGQEPPGPRVLSRRQEKKLRADDAD